MSDRRFDQLPIWAQWAFIACGALAIGVFFFVVWTRPELPDFVKGLLMTAVLVWMVASSWLNRSGQHPRSNHDH